MKLRLREVSLVSSTAPTRLPFRFGVTTLTSGTTLVARVRIETEASSRAVEGFAADLLVPKWFEKDPRKSAEEDVAALIASAREAALAYLAPGPEATAFDHAWRVARERFESLPEGAPDRLVRGFGAALVERATIDAACRAAGLSFFEALRGDENVLGFDAARAYPELAGVRARDFLPARPQGRVAVRHTVGLADALRDGDVAPDARVGDGFPESLDGEARRRGLSWFKVKLSGDPNADVARLVAVAEVLGEVAAPDWRLTVDGNEQFPSFGAVEAFLDGLAASEGGRRVVARLAHFEQPLPRAATLDPRHAPSAALAARVPFVIDEADSGAFAFPAAVSLGYRGVSAKNCKGVFRAVAHAALVAAKGGGLFLSAEDLTTLPVLALQQDLATVAALGLTHAERNGHHYFRGLAHLPAAEARDALAAHPDLYETTGDVAALRVRDGGLSLSSLDREGFGYDVRIRVEERTPVLAYRA